MKACNEINKYKVKMKNRKKKKFSFKITEVKHANEKKKNSHRSSIKTIKKYQVRQILICIIMATTTGVLFYKPQIYKDLFQPQLGFEPTT